MSLTTTGQKPRSPVLPMGWLEWSHGDGEYVGGAYRVRLVEPYRWEVLWRGEHLLFDSSLRSALTRADHHHRERLRARDLVRWAKFVAAAVAAAALLEAADVLHRLWSIPALAAILYVGLAALVRFFAAATRNRSDPYRRPAPWEPRRWWQR